MIRSTRRDLLRRSLAAAALGLAPGLLQACAPAPAAPGGGPSATRAPATGGTRQSATIVLPGQFVETMNPYAHSVGGIYPTWKHVIEPLVEYDFDKKQVSGVLAESWTNPDSNTWLIKLRQGVKLHDGSDFTSADVVYSFVDRIQKDPDSKQAEQVQHQQRPDRQTRQLGELPFGEARHRPPLRGHRLPAGRVALQILVIPRKGTLGLSRVFGEMCPAIGCVPPLVVFAQKG